MRLTSHFYIKNLIERYPKLTQLKTNLEYAIEIMIKSIKNQGTILICGNGGSASDSDHIVGELMKGFNLKRTISKDLIRKLK